jgi:GTP cyclohydrolase I
MFAKRLQVQERLTDEIASVLYNKLEAKAVGVRITARHMCMESRGICKQGTTTTTTSTKGLFKDRGGFREEFLKGIE